METAEAAAVMPSTAPRWFHLTPGRCVLLLLVIEAVLFLSSRFHWFPFNEHKGYTVLVTIATVGVALVLMLLWFVVSLLFRWRFQFSIRSLLVLTVVVAIPCSWLAAEMKQAEQQRATVEGLDRVVTVMYDDGWNESLCTGPTEPLEPAWLRRLLGDDFFVAPNCYISTRITDSELKHIEGLTQLRWLFLDSASVTDVGLEYLKSLTRLGSLEISNTRVTDAGLEHLKDLTQLQWLDLGNTRVTDAGLKHLKGLIQLQDLYLNGTQVTDAGVENLQQALPNLRIVR